VSGAPGIFRRRLWLWLPPALVLAFAVFFLARFWATGRTVGGSLDRRLAAASAARDTAVAEEKHLAELTRAADANRADIERLYSERFSTESGRFTDLIREIKRLAEHAGLDPREIGYPEELLDGFDLERRSFQFTVEGSYANLRMFLYLLEFSPSFVTVDEIRVGERTGKGVRVELKLSTFFARTPEPAAPRRGAAS
jgi:hypothetical protein